MLQDNSFHINLNFTCLNVVTWFALAELFQHLTEVCFITMPRGILMVLLLKKKVFLHKSSRSRQPYIGLIFIFNAAGGNCESEPIIITERLIPSKSRGHREKEMEDLYREHSSISTVQCSFWNAQAVRSQTCSSSILYGHGHVNPSFGVESNGRMNS